MKPEKIIYFLFILFLGCSSEEADLFLSDDFVNLKEQEALTIIKNSTRDTLKLSGQFFNNLPYDEHRFDRCIAPDQRDTLRFNFSCPDFIYISSPQYLRIFNSPGKILYCNVQRISSDSATIEFKGDMADVNVYYLTYHNQMGSQLEQNRPYFHAGDTLRDFNKFPAIADSLTRLSLAFLDQYEKPLPSWFKNHESWRLKYLSGFLTYNVLFSKEFYSGKKIEVSKDYYSFTNQLPLDNQEMVLNTEYLWYAQFHIGERGKSVATTKESDGQLSYIDSLYGQSESGDILKMKRLLDIYRVNKDRFHFLFPKTTFTNESNKEILDSLLKAKFGLPRIGKVLPELTLTNMKGEEVSIEQHKGSFLIVNFWATWCGPCMEEFPYENEIHGLYKDKGLKVINVCVDSELDQWRAISTEKNLKTVNLFSSGDYSSVSKDFDINGLPKSLLIDRNLIVLDNNFGRASSLKKYHLEEMIKGEWSGYQVND